MAKVLEILTPEEQLIKDIKKARGDATAEVYKVLPIQPTAAACIVHEAEMEIIREHLFGKDKLPEYWARVGARVRGRMT